MELDQDLLNVFYEEVEELTSELESSLMELDGKSDDPELINKILRNFHTIKGSCALAGFTKISDFIHKIETIYQNIRDGKFNVKKKLIDLSLKANDYIRILVDNIDAVSNDDINNLIEKIYKLYNLKIEKEKEKKSETVTEVSQKIEKTIYLKIEINPKEDFYLRDGDISEIFHSLREIGEVTIICNNQHVPEITHLNPVHSYLSWDVYVETEKTINEIKDIFIFLENEEFIIREIEDNEIKRIKKFQNKKEEHLEKKSNLNKSITVSKDTFLKVSQHKLDILLDLVGELVINQSILSSFSKKYDYAELTELSENFETLITELRDITLNIRMVQIGSFLNKFKRTVRDIAEERGKKVNVIIEGGETELDKSVIDIMMNPLTHILRNSIDHGIEPIEERLKKGKLEEGTILIKAEHDGGNIVISIKDDGCGIDTEKVKKRAIAMGILSENSNLSDSEIINYIFHPGLSTSEKVSNISGRGVGMDVVKKEIKKVGGDVSIFSEKDRGTEIKITLPLTLAIIEGMMIEVFNSFFVIPIEFVKHCIEYIPDTKYEIEHGKVIEYMDKIVPFIRLREYFKISNKVPKVEEIVFVEFSNNLFGISVDRIIGQKQIVIKNFGPILNKLNCFSGATINGDGSLALILDIIAIFNNLKDNFSK